MPSTALSDAQTVCGYLAPASVSAGTATLSTWIDLKSFRRVQFVLPVGVISAGGTVDAKVQQATSSSGTGAKDLASPKAITQLTQAGGNGNSVVVLNVRESDVDSNGGFEFVNVTITVGTAAAILGVIALGDPEVTPPVVNGTGIKPTQIVQ